MPNTNYALSFKFILRKVLQLKYKILCQIRNNLQLINQ
jgi:hypothetical protein